MQKSPGGWPGHQSLTLGPGATWPPPTAVQVGVRCRVGGRAPGHPGPCKRSDPQMVGTFLLQVAALKPPVSAGHGQRWEGQDGAETGGGCSSRASQPPREPLLGSLSPSLVGGPSGTRGPSAPTQEGGDRLSHQRDHTPWERGGEAREPSLLSAEALRLPAQVWLQNFGPFLEKTVLQEKSV